MHFNKRSYSPLKSTYNTNNSILNYYVFSLCRCVVSLPYFYLACSSQSPLSALHLSKLKSTHLLPIIKKTIHQSLLCFLLIYYLLKNDYILFQPWNSLELQTLGVHLGLQCKLTVQLDLQLHCWRAFLECTEPCIEAASTL